jgi:hypothetical protein
MEKTCSGTIIGKKVFKVQRSNTEATGIKREHSGLVLERLSFKMALCIKESLRIKFSMEREEWPMLMEIFTKVTGRMAKLMVMVSLLILKAQCMKGNGKKINSMEWEQKPGIKDKSGILDNFKMVKKPEEEDLSSMEATMMVTLSMESSMAKENTILLILVKFMRVILKITICTEAV